MKSKLNKFLQNILMKTKEIEEDDLLLRTLFSFCISIMCFIGPIITLIGIILLPIILLLILIDKLYCLITKNKFYKKEIFKIKSKVNDYYNDKFTENYYLKGYSKQYHVRLEFFIEKFIVEYRNVYNTYGSISNKHICDTGRRRSTGDIYLICKHYFPECTLDDVIKVLIHLLENRVICGSYCNTIRKFVYHNSSSYSNLQSKTEFDIGYDLIIKAYK